MDKSRTQALIGENNVEKIASKRVTIVGVGGVGGYVATLLARAGVEKMRIIDFDTVSPSNFNRQVVAVKGNEGKLKVEALKDILLSINEDIEVDSVPQKLDKDNVSSLLENSDIVVDAIDIVKDKVALIIYCKKHNINVISAMGAGNRYDQPNFYLTDIYKTHDDGLAKVIRKALREEGVKNLDVVTCDSKPEKVEGVIGSISYYPAVCGAVITAAVVNKIIKEEI
mgnify:CR=1 FL=1